MSMTETELEAPMSHFQQPSFFSRILFPEGRGYAESPTTVMVYNDPSFDAMLVNDMPCPTSVEQSSLSSGSTGTSHEQENEIQPLQRSATPIDAAYHRPKQPNDKHKEPAPTETQHEPQKGAAKRRKERNEAVGFVLVERAEAHASLHHWETAFQLWERALEKQKQKLGDCHMMVGQTLLRRGRAYARLGMSYEAILDLEKAFHIQEREAGEEHTQGTTLLLDMAATLLELGKAQQQRGFNADALKSLHRCLTLTKEAYGKEAHESVAKIVCIIGKFHHQQRDYEEASVFYQKGLELYQQSGIPRHHPQVVWVRKCMTDRNMTAQRFFSVQKRATL